MFQLGNDWIPGDFWPYTSVVLQRIFQIPTKRGDQFDAMRMDLLGMFNASGIRCRDDNKIVFELVNRNTMERVYLGFYDNVFSIGKSMHTDDYNIQAKRHK